MSIDTLSVASSAEKNTSPEMREYRDRLLHETETFLYNPALQELIVAAETEGRLSEDEVNELAGSQDDPEAYAAKITLLVEKAMNWRGDGMKKLERHQMKDTDLSPEFKAAIRRAAGEMEMENEVPIPNEHFKVAAILGATVKPIAERTDYLFDSFENGIGSADLVVGLGAEREMMAPDLKNAETYSYVNDSKVETDLLAHASQDWFTQHGYDTPAITSYGYGRSHQADENFYSPYRIEATEFGEDQHRPEWAPEAIISFSSPFESKDHPRAHTGETIHFLKKLGELQDGDSVLFISHQPYLLGQKFAIEQACLDNGIRATVAGYEDRNPALATTVLGSEIAKAAKFAYQLRAELLDQAA